MTFGILPIVNSVSQNGAVSSAISARFHTGRLKVNLSKKPKQDGDKSAVALLKNVRQLGCVFQDTEQPESLPIVSKSAGRTCFMFV